MKMLKKKTSGQATTRSEERTIEMIANIFTRNPQAKPSGFFFSNPQFTAFCGIPACLRTRQRLHFPGNRPGENMIPTPSTPKHEIVLKDLREERKAESQRLDKLRLKVTRQLSRPREMLPA
jgi:hypothetical protein